MSSRQEFKKQVIKYYYENIDKGKSYTVKHFQNLGESQSTIYHMIREAERSGGSTASSSSSTTRKPLGDSTNNSGRVTKKTSVPTKSVLVEDFNNSELTSRAYRLLATCRQRCGSIYRKYPNHDWVLDNKCAFTYRCNQGSKYRSYYTFEGDTRPPPVIYEEDLLPRLDVWIAFSNQGISEPFIASVDENFDTKVFYEKCLRSRLVPFVKENHDLTRTVVWTDAASTTSNKRVFDCLDNEGIKYVTKEDNPGNRVRCFSYFWTILKNAVYEDNWIAKNNQDLERRIRRCLAQIDIENVIRIANDTEKRILEMHQSGEIKEYNYHKQKYIRETY